MGSASPGRLVPWCAWEQRQFSCSRAWKDQPPYEPSLARPLVAREREQLSGQPERALVVRLLQGPPAALQCLPTVCSRR